LKKEPSNLETKRKGGYLRTGKNPKTKLLANAQGGGGKGSGEKCPKGGRKDSLQNGGKEERREEMDGKRMRKEGVVRGETEMKGGKVSCLIS